MKALMDNMRHLYVGNDRPPWAVALTRAIVGAVIIGGLGFLAVWQATDDVKVLITAGVTPALTHLALRFGLEGFVDSGKRS